MRKLFVAATLFSCPCIPDSCFPDEWFPDGGEDTTDDTAGDTGGDTGDAGDTGGDTGDPGDTSIHADWTWVLTTYAEEISHDDGGLFRLIDYPAMLDDGSDAVVEGYLAELALIDPAVDLTSGDERLAFYINLYNAAVVDRVLDELAIDPAFRVDADSWAMFTDPYIAVNDTLIAPDWLEHGVIRYNDYTVGLIEAHDADLVDVVAAMHTDLWADVGGVIDARIHVGLNCASMGCPNIGAEAFEGDVLDEQLDSMATVWLDNPIKGASVDGVSSVLCWFEGDFDTSFGSVEDFVATHRTDGTTDVDFDTCLYYDWELNDINRWPY